MDYKWVIDKSFHFEMGHRVWSQKLDRPDLSITCDCACKHLHGHSYTIKVFLGSDKLDNTQMVLDFRNLSFMKEFVDDVLDHKFMIDINDPFFSIITNINLPPNILIDNFTNLRDFVQQYELVYTLPDEFINGFVLVNFVPTSENICKYLKEYAQDRLAGVATVTALELWETAKSHCRYQ